MTSLNYLVPADLYARIARAAYLALKFPARDTEGMVRYLVEAKTAGNGSHDLRKMLHLLEMFGPLAGDPNGKVSVLHEGPVISRWNCGGALGPQVIYDAIDRAITCANNTGIGMVVGVEYSHYGCGFPYGFAGVQRGYMVKLWSTASLAEVVPFGGKRPATGTNAWTLGIPVEPGRHFVLDMATSSMARGVVQALEVRARAGEQVSLPPDCALDAQGNMTTDPLKVVALLPFGKQKGGGLSLFSELLCALAGGGRPSVRCLKDHADAVDGERQSTTFVLQVVDPKQLWCDPTGDGAAQVLTVTEDIFGDGNEKCMMPGEPEQRAIAETTRLGGLTFGAASLESLIEIATQYGVKSDGGGEFKLSDFATV